MPHVRSWDPKHVPIQTQSYIEAFGQDNFLFPPMLLIKFVYLVLKGEKKVVHQGGPGTVTIILCAYYCKNKNKNGAWSTEYMKSKSIELSQWYQLIRMYCWYVFLSITKAYLFLHFKVRISFSLISQSFILLSFEYILHIRGLISFQSKTLFINSCESNIINNNIFLL